MLSSPDKEDDDSSICAIGFSSSPEPISPTGSLLSRLLSSKETGTEASSPLAIGFSDSEKSSPAILPCPWTDGTKIRNQKTALSITTVFEHVFSFPFSYQLSISFSLTRLDRAAA
ncbi:Hypothetical predicted protein [Paramuricea clavata]|uniref:Uncharacterized protein n=1 Tax=Paramuricea clavata TaxID=317549 RepID=A0A6S7JLB0_PARCT|nr:Hypothetical predicted protein [Paramuricea clavata]